MAIGGKGIVRKSAAFKQAGLIAPKAYNTDSAVEGERLLAECNLKDKSGRLVGRQFGENDPTLGQFNRGRPGASKSAVTTLEDEGELGQHGSANKFDDYGGIETGY